MRGRVRAPLAVLLLAMALAGCAVVRDTRTGNIYEVGPGHVFKPYEEVIDRYGPVSRSMAALSSPRWMFEYGGVFANGGMTHPFAPAATDAWAGGSTFGLGAETGCYYIPGTEVCLRLGGFVNVTSLSGESPPNFGLETSSFRVPAVVSARATAYVPITGTSLQAFGGIGPAFAYREGTFGGARDSGWSLGWQLTGGLEYTTSAYSKIRLAYTYTGLQPLKYDFPAGIVKVDTNLHAFSIGYTRAFGSGLALDTYNPAPNAYQTGTGRWVAGVDIGWSSTRVGGPDFTTKSDAISGAVFGGYHHALAVDPAAGVVTWGRFETGLAFSNYATELPGVYHGNIGPIISLKPGISWQFLGTSTRPDICVFLLGGVAAAQVQDHFVGATETRTKIGWEIGAGFELAVAKNWAARFSYTHTDLGDTQVLNTKFEHKVDRFSLGLLYRTVPPPPPPS